MKTRKFNFLHILLMTGLIVLPISCDDEAFLEEDLRDELSPATFYVVCSSMVYAEGQLYCFRRRSLCQNDLACSFSIFSR